MGGVYATRVRAVGTGTVVDENGRSLLCIGRLHVDVGDIVYTDGRVVYGHERIEEGGLILDSPLNGIVIKGRRESDVIVLSPKGKDITERVKPYYENVRYDTIKSVRNWFYTEKNELYGLPTGREDKSAYLSEDDLGFYLDMIVTENLVLTAEFAPENAPFMGKKKAVTEQYRYLNFTATNFYFTYSPNTIEPFTFKWQEYGGLNQNPIVVIRKNGERVASFALSDYLFALDKLKEIFLQYDVYDGDKNLKRYRMASTMYNQDGKTEYIKNVDVWVAYAFTQLLHFHFTDSRGNWEAIICSICEGTCHPHTIDEEPNQETGEMEGKRREQADREGELKMQIKKMRQPVHSGNIKWQK